MELIYQVRAPECAGCGACLVTCPQHAVRPGPPRPGGGRPPLILADRCTGCGECMEVCPVDAIESLTRETRARSGIRSEPLVLTG